MYNLIPKEFLINDTRTHKDFEKKTFNGYKKNEVFNELQKNILSGNIEKSILWSTELNCSGYTTLILDKLFYLYIKEINKANLSIINLFIKDIKLFEKKKNSKDKNPQNFGDLRNDQYIRNHISNLVCILTFSSKYKLPKSPNITSYDFNMKNNKSKIISKDLNAIQVFIKKNDPKNIIIPLSEILLNLNNKNISKSLDNALFWLNWIFIYEKNIHNGYIKCHNRNINDIDTKYINDFTWIIWEIIFSLSDNHYIKKLYSLYKLDFNKSKRKKKIDLIIIAFIIIIDPFPKIVFDKELITPQQNIIKNRIISNINYQYLDIYNNSSDLASKINNPTITLKNNNTTIFSNENLKLSTDTKNYIDEFSKNRHQSHDTINTNLINKNIKNKNKNIINNLITNTTIKKNQNNQDCILSKIPNFNLKDYVVDNKIPININKNKTFSLKKTKNELDNLLTYD